MQYRQGVRFTFSSSETIEIAVKITPVTTVSSFNPYIYNIIPQIFILQ